MNAGSMWIGWGLASVAVVVGYLQYGWKGLLLALTVTVFWLLLQFSRALRVMRAAGAHPVGHVASAVMMHAQLRSGMRMLDVVKLSQSLGERLGEEPERWRWRDEGGVAVETLFERGSLREWKLVRPAEGGPAPALDTAGEAAQARRDG